MMQMNAGGHPLSIAAIKWTILQQGVREPTGVAIPSRGTRAIPGVVGQAGACALKCDLLCENTPFFFVGVVFCKAGT